jgi:hypothetical protein
VYPVRGAGTLLDVSFGVAALAEREELHDLAGEVLVGIRFHIAVVVEVGQHGRVADDAAEQGRIAQGVAAEHAVLHKQVVGVFHRAVAGGEVAVPEEGEFLLQRPGGLDHPLEPPPLHIAHLLPVRAFGTLAGLTELIDDVLVPPLAGTPEHVAFLRGGRTHDVLVKLVAAVRLCGDVLIVHQMVYGLLKAPGDHGVDLLGRAAESGAPEQVACLDGAELLGAQGCEEFTRGLGLHGHGAAPRGSSVQRRTPPAGLHGRFWSGLWGAPGSKADQPEGPQHAKEQEDRPRWPGAGW